MHFLMPHKKWEASHLSEPPRPVPSSIVDRMEGKVYFHPSEEGQMTTAERGAFPPVLHRPGKTTVPGRRFVRPKLGQVMLMGTVDTLIVGAVAFAVTPFWFSSS